MGFAEYVVVADQEIFAVALLFVLLRVSTERRGLDHLAAAIEHVHQTKTPADDARVAKQAAHVVRTSAGGHVEILGAATDQQIPNAPADQIAFVAIAHETPHDLGGVGVESFFVQLHVVDLGLDGVLHGLGRRVLRQPLRRHVLHRVLDAMR